ncbi:helix-turn-helix transcriptional regulator [Staphylococcus pasteuri]|uniref:helix-turn-helix domain-containing protein n=1 Tax=Staphylococcus pasteuri TaxID=45972 RepID=UPI0032612E44
MELDKVLKKLRIENSVTQEELALSINVSVQSINKWENGKCLPDAINLMHLANFYNVSLDALMSNEVPSECQKEKLTDKEIKFLKKFILENG